MQWHCPTPNSQFFSNTCLGTKPDARDSAAPSKRHIALILLQYEIPYRLTSRSAALFDYMRYEACCPTDQRQATAKQWIHAHISDYRAVCANCIPSRTVT
jgi:hypothetical protein